MRGSLLNSGGRKQEECHGPVDKRRWVDGGLYDFFQVGWAHGCPNEGVAG